MEFLLVALAVLVCLATASLDGMDPGQAETVSARVLDDPGDLDHLLCKRLSRLSRFPAGHHTWPLAGVLSAQPGGDVLVGTVDGLIVARAVLGVAYHPYCELENLCVRPDYRGRVLATAIVREAVRRARSTGLKYMVLQEIREDAEAHGIYTRAGFWPATLGEMQRLVCLLDVPVVSLLLCRRSGHVFESEAAPDRGDQWWRMTWRGADEHVTLFLHGGSCQSDSDGFQPVFHACELAHDGVALAAEVDAEPSVSRGGVLQLTVNVENRGARPLAGAIRAALPPHTAVVGHHALSAFAFELEAAGSTTVTLPMRVDHAFACDPRRFSSYPSTPFTAGVCWDGGSMLLSRAIKVS